LPLEEVIDPTGAGDSFAGASSATWPRPPRRRAHSGRLPAPMFYGSVMAPSPASALHRALQKLTRKEIDDRFILFRELTHLD